MDKIKILYIIATLDIGGTEKQLFELAKGLDRKKYEPVVCCLTRSGPVEKDLRDRGIRVIEAGKKGKLDFGFLFKLAGIIRREKPGIVHTFLWTSNTWGRIAAMFAGVPVIISSERSTDYWKGWFEFLIDWKLSLFTKKIIVNSLIVKKFIGSRGISEKKIEVVPNGIDTSLYGSLPGPSQAKKMLGLDPLAPAVGFAGRLCREKDPFVFVRLAAAVLKEKSAQFVIAGDGEMRGGVEALAGSLGVKKNLRILGYRNDMPLVLSAMDVVVLTSLWEGLPNVLIEAGAAAKPAVTLNVGGAGEVVEDGRTGFVVSVSDEKGLAEKVLVLLKGPALCAEMGAAARQRVEENFKLSKMISMTEAIYSAELQKTAR